MSHPLPGPYEMTHGDYAWGFGFLLAAAEAALSAGTPRSAEILEDAIDRMQQLQQEGRVALQEGE